MGARLGAERRPRDAAREGGWHEALEEAAGVARLGEDEAKDVVVRVRGAVGGGRGRGRARVGGCASRRASAGARVGPRTRTRGRRAARGRCASGGHAQRERQGACAEVGRRDLGGLRGDPNGPGSAVGHAVARRWAGVERMGSGERISAEGPTGAALVGSSPAADATDAVPFAITTVPRERARLRRRRARAHASDLDPSFRSVGSPRRGGRWLRAAHDPGAATRPPPPRGEARAHQDPHQAKAALGYPPRSP